MSVRRTQIPIKVRVSPAGPLEWCDRGGTHRLSVQIENLEPTRVILISLAGHRFGPPDFERLTRMKAPPAPSWDWWRNVLAPGQRTTVRLPAERLVPGLYHRVLALTVMLPTGPWAASHIHHLGASHAFVTDQAQPLLVTWRHQGRACTHTERWRLRVAPNPVVARIAPPVDDFRLDVPILGALAVKDDLILSVREGQARPLGRGTLEAFSRLGETLERDAAAEILAAPPTPSVIEAFALERMALPIVATDRVTTLPAEVGRVRLTADHLAALWAAMSADELRLICDPVHGLALRPIRDGALLPVALF